MKRTIEERFWSKVDRRGPDECWEWQAGRYPYGYGQFWYKNINRGSHRVAYELSIGAIPDNLEVLHSCDNPPCCNPAHLWLGTNIDNMADRDRKQRQKAGRGDRHGTHTHPESRTQGERNGQSKLTTNQVIAIRIRYAQGGILQRQLAVEYGVSRRTIGFIIRGKHWRHVR